MPGESSRGHSPHSRAQTRGILAGLASRRETGARRHRMKLEGLLRHLRRNGCVLRREGKEHSLWENPQTGHAVAVPRHAEIANLLAKRICRKLSIPDPSG